MIDFTKIQAFPIVPPLFELQKTNTNLLKENKLLKNVIQIGIGVAIVYSIAYLYNKYKENEANKKK